MEPRERAVQGLRTGGGPEAIGVVTSTQLVARIYPHVGPRRMMSAGLGGVAVAIVLMAFIDRDTSLWVIRFLMFALGSGMAFLFLPNQAASLATVFAGSRPGLVPGVPDAVRQPRRFQE